MSRAAGSLHRLRRQLEQRIADRNDEIDRLALLVERDEAELEQVRTALSALGEPTTDDVEEEREA